MKPNIKLIVLIKALYFKWMFSLMLCHEHLLNVCSIVDTANPFHCSTWFLWNCHVSPKYTLSLWPQLISPGIRYMTQARSITSFLQKSGGWNREMSFFPYIRMYKSCRQPHSTTELRDRRKGAWSKAKMELMCRARQRKAKEIRLPTGLQPIPVTLLAHGF